MIIVTGGIGFIGSNIIAKLNAQARKDILVVDDLRLGKKISNLASLDIIDYVDFEDFLLKIDKGYSFGPVEAVLHQGACSATTEWDGRFMMKNNYEYSKKILHWCQNNGIQCIYASSASVYGLGKNGFQEERRCEHPINMYAYSKFQFDQYVRHILATCKHQVVGLRYFNVYGPNEAHKGDMASTIWHFNNQIISQKKTLLFQGVDGYGDGEQKRDFIFVDDCVSVILWFLNNKNISGIYNVGTGQASSFNQVAQAVIDWYGYGEIAYIPFPDYLKGCYQNYTQADLANLYTVGYQKKFYSIQEGIKIYLDKINK